MPRTAYLSTLSVLLFFISSSINAAQRRSSSMDRKEQKKLQEKCLREVQAFLVKEGYPERDLTRTFNPSSTNTARTQSGNLSEIEGKETQAACVAKVRVFLKKPSATHNPVLSSEEMIKELQQAGYTVKGNTIYNEYGQVVAYTKPFKDFADWYLERLKSKKPLKILSKKTVPPFNNDNFPPISN